MGERAVAAGLLIPTGAALVWFVKGDLREWRLFQRLVDTGARQDRYRRWCLKQWLAFALPALAGLLLLGRLDALVTMPAAFTPLAAQLPVLDRASVAPLATGGAIGITIGAGLAMAAMGWRRRHGVVKANPPLTLGNVASLLPRNRAEMGWSALLSASAGVTEELAFRLFLPLLLVLLGVPALPAFLAAAAVFGALHLYQGWIGVAATTVIGLLMTAAYLMSGALWVAMLLHVLLDLNGLVLRPLLAGAWRPA